MSWVQLEKIVGKGSGDSASGHPRRNGDVPEKRAGRAFSARAQPGWAKGLQRLYDEVVDEELPPEFADLLNQLDQISDDG